MRWDSAKDRYFITAENGRLLGEVVGKTYITPRTVNHFFKKFSGFGISQEVIEELMVLKVKWIIFEYSGKEGKSMFRVSMEDFVNGGTLWYDDSWGKPDAQFILPVKEMEVIKGRG